MAKSLRLNASLNGFKQILSVVFPLITFPYVSRILGSTEYGRYSFSSAVISFFLLFSGFGISVFGVREGAKIRNEKEKISKLASDLFSLNCVSVFVALLLLFLSIRFNVKLHSYKYLLLIQCSCFFMNLVGMDWVNVVYEDYCYITVRYIVIQLISLILIFIFIKSPEDILLYALIMVCASYGGNLVNIFYVRKYVDLKFSLKIDFRLYLLPLFLLFVNSLATTVYVNSDITLLGFFKSDDDVGVYSFAAKIYNMVKYFINAIMIVSVPRLAYLHENQIEEYDKFLTMIFDILSICIFPMSIGMVMLGKSMIIVAGGTAYISGTSALQVLSISLIFALYSSVHTNCILITNRKEKYCLISTVCSAIINVVLNFLLIQKLGILACAITTVVAEAINYFVQNAFSQKKLHFIYKVRFEHCITIVVGCLLTFLVCFFVSYEGASVFYNAVRIFFCVLFSVALYAIFLILTKNMCIKYFLHK